MQAGNRCSDCINTKSQRNQAQLVQFSLSLSLSLSLSTSATLTCMLIIYLPPEMHCDDNAAAVFSAPCVTDTVRTHKSVQCVRTLQNEDYQSKREKRRAVCGVSFAGRRRDDVGVCRPNTQCAVAMWPWQLIE